MLLVPHPRGKPLYSAAHARVVELVDTADSKSADLTVMGVRFSPGHHGLPVDELLSMNFCSHCGSKVAFRVPPGDHLPRYICDSCGTIHYQNPRVVVGCVPETEDGRILLCKRAIEPRKGYWTVPRRIHGERGIASAGRCARGLRRSTGRHRDRLAAGRGEHHQSRTRCTSSSGGACARRSSAPGRRASR